jgi:hypothetical protein
MVRSNPREVRHCRSFTTFSISDFCTNHAWEFASIAAVLGAVSIVEASFFVACI